MIQIARQIDDWVSEVDPLDRAETAEFASRLRRYGDILKPWASSVASRMLAEVADLDRQGWKQRSAEMGRLLRSEIETAPTGTALRSLLHEQVGLITSLPTKAAERVQRLSMEGLVNATRAKEIAAEIMRSGDVSRSLALTIARTEVSRSRTTLVEARAVHAGSTGYTWRTSEDGDVRESHRKMAGVFVPWNKPPTLDKLTGHAGCLPNCRCWADPVFG